MGIAVPNKALNRPVVHGENILEHEHALANLLGQHCVVHGQAVENALLADTVHVVHHVGYEVYAAHLNIAAAEDIGKFIRHFRLDNFYRGRGSAIHSGDALHHLNLIFRLQLGDYCRRLIRVYIRENQGNGLGPFVLQGCKQVLFPGLVHKGEFPVL